jgi:hypothetical protein
MGRKQRVGERKKLNKIKVKLIDYTEPAEMMERKSRLKSESWRTLGATQNFLSREQAIMTEV